MQNEFKDMYRINNKKVYTSSKRSRVRLCEEKDKSRKINPRLIALVISVMAAGGAVGMVHTKKDNVQNLNKLIEAKADLSVLGMRNETIDTLLKYNEYFNSTSAKDIGNKDLKQVTEELYDLNLNMIKEKIGQVEPYTPEQLEVLLHYEKSDGTKTTSVCLKSIKQDKKIIADNRNLPNEFCDIAWQLASISTLENELSEDLISDVNAWKQLKKYYGQLSKFASKELIKDEKGKLTLVDYQEVEKSNKQNEIEER